MNQRGALTALVVAALTSSLVSGIALQTRQDHAQTAAASRAAIHAQADRPHTPPATIPPPPPPPPPPSPSPSIAPPRPSTTPTPKPKPVRAKGAPCVSTVRACVKLSSKQAWLLDATGKVVLGPVPITSGKKGEATPTGMWSVLWKDKDHKSQEFDDAPMPYSVFFAPGGIAFHTGSLRAQSSGCIHLANSTAARFFSALSVGDGVQVVK